MLPTQAAPPANAEHIADEMVRKGYVGIVDRVDNRNANLVKALDGLSLLVFKQKRMGVDFETQDHRSCLIQAIEDCVELFGNNIQ